MVIEHLLRANSLSQLIFFNPHSYKPVKQTSFSSILLEGIPRTHPYIQSFHGPAHTTQVLSL